LQRVSAIEQLYGFHSPEVNRSGFAAWSAVRVYLTEIVVGYLPGRLNLVGKKKFERSAAGSRGLSADRTVKPRVFES
jgi:hypothetical protein